jgi:hypothetical protein
MWDSKIKPAIRREIEKVFKELKTIEVCSYQDYYARKRTHPERTVLLNALMPIVVKLSVDGEFTKVKPRLVVADSVEISKMGDVFSPTVGADTVRRQANLEVQLQALSVALDASDAYHLGTPLDPLSEHGRFIYVRPVKDLALAGLDPVFSDKQNLWSVVGNVPGIQDAGVRWGDHFGIFLKSKGYSQSIVDRRLYYRRDLDGTLSLVCVYVDDNRMTSTSKAVRDEFVTSFERNFPNSVAPGALAASVANDFAGAKYEKIGEGTDARIEVSCPRLHAKLRKMIEALPADQQLIDGVPTDTPMDKDALKTLYESAKRDPHLSEKRVKAAQRIGGLGGYIVLCCRPDAYFAYVVLTQYLGHGLTVAVWDALIRWATYIYVNTALRLTYRAGSAGQPWEMYVDSSLFNAPNSRSMGGFCALYPGSGVFTWRCFSPRKLGTSSGAAETIMAAHAVHHILGQRILDRELGIHTGEPTKLYTDNLATLQGTQMENVPQDQRYLAARRAVLRQAAIEEKVVRLLKVATDDNPADIFTKPLEGAQFFKLRAMILGISAEDLALSAPPVATSKLDVECVQFLAGLEADSSLCKLRRGSLPREELCLKDKNAGAKHGCGPGGTNAGAIFSSRTSNLSPNTYNIHSSVNR